MTRNGKIGPAALFLCAAILLCCASGADAATERYNRRKLVTQDHIKAGRVYYDIKMYDKAAEQWEKALELDPYDRKTASLLESAKKKLEIGSRAAAIKEHGAIESRPAADAGGPETQAEEPQAAGTAEYKPDAAPSAIKEEPKPDEAPAAGKPAAQESAPSPAGRQPEGQTAGKTPAVDSEPSGLTEKEPESPSVGEAAVQEQPGQARPEYVQDASMGKLGAPVVVDGDKVEYFHEAKEVIGEGNISIKYKDITLTCDKVTVFLGTRDAVAEGNVKITQKAAYFTGDRIKYNFDTKEAQVLDGYVNAEPFYGKAKELSKPPDKNEFKLESGYATTCDRAHPHYRIQAKQVRIYPDDKVIAKHILFFIGNVPVMYWPYYYQSLKETKTHVTVIPGQSKDWGYYALTSCRYHLDDNNMGDLMLDYRSKKGLGEGICHYYSLGELGKGAFKFFYTHENDSFAYEKTGAVQNRYRWQARHRWDLPEGTDTYAIMEFNKMSDANMIKDYFFNEYEEITASPDSYVSVLTQKTDYTTELLIRGRFDKFQTVVQRLPEYRIDVPKFNFKNTSIYYTGHAAGVYLNEAYDTTNTTDSTRPKSAQTVRFDVYNRLAYAARLFKALNVTPYGGVRNTYYSRNRWEATNQVRTIFDAGVENSIKFYKIYDANTDFLGLDINKLRHVITPTLTYYYTHQPTISPDCLHQFDAIDAFVAQNGFLMALENKLQTKRKHGDGYRSVDLATLIVSTDYAFRLKKNNLSFKSDKFNGIYFDLEIVPYDWAFLKCEMSVNTKTYSVETQSIDLTAHWKDLWSVSIGQRYEDVQTGMSNLLSYEATYNFWNQWKVKAYGRFDAANGFFQEQEYTVIKDLHCWTAEFAYDIGEQANQTFWVVFRLKAFPETPIGLGRTYSRARFGATGR